MESEATYLTRKNIAGFLPSLSINPGIIMPRHILEDKPQDEKLEHI